MEGKMRQLAAEDLVLLDGSIFNEKTGWRYCAYGPIGNDIRYPVDIQRRCTWSICAAIITSGWLPYTGVKEGYFQTPDILNWIQYAIASSLQGRRPTSCRSVR